MRIALLLAVGIMVTSAAAQPTPAKPVPVRKVRGAGDAPAIEMFDAVAKARAYARKNRISLAKQYLQSASFDVVARTWSLAWQLPNAKGGRTELVVGEDGKIEVSYGD